MKFIQAKTDRPKRGGGTFEAMIIINPATVHYAVYSPAMTIQAHGSDKELESSLELMFAGTTKETLKGVHADYVWNELKRFAP